MVINISVQQYNGGLIPDIILLTQGVIVYYYYHVTCDVLHCFLFVFNVFLVSLRGD